MKGSEDAVLKAALKQLIVTEADKPIDPASIADDAPLFGPKSPVGLDSIDSLQISMALNLRYGKRVEDPKEARRVMTSVNALADFIQPE